MPAVPVRQVRTGLPTPAQRWRSMPAERGDGNRGTKSLPAGGSVEGRRKGCKIRTAGEARAGGLPFKTLGELALPGLWGVAHV